MTPVHIRYRKGRAWELIGTGVAFAVIRFARHQMAPKGEPWICLDLHDEARVLADPAFAPAAARARMARWVNATPFSLRATPLDVSNDELMRLIQAWLARRPTGQAVA